MPNNIIGALQTGFIEISELIRFSNSIELSNTENCHNKSGDFVKKLDLQTNNILKHKLFQCTNVRAIGSEEENTLCYTPNKDGNYLVCFDPLDGSSNIDSNITVGTIFAIYEYRNNCIQNGHNIVCAGYCLYGGSTQLIIANNEGVNMMLLTKNDGFSIMEEKININEKGKTYSINESNKYIWKNPKYLTMVQKCIDQKYTCRWVGSMVADAHRTLMKGGLFSYPSNNKDTEGKIRLLYEAYPFAYIFKQAGGYSSNDDIPILDIPFPQNIHQKTPIFLSGKHEFFNIFI